MDPITMAEVMNLPAAHRASIFRAATYIALADAAGTPLNQATARLAMVLATASARIYLAKVGAP